MSKDALREASRLIKDHVRRLKPVQKAAILLHCLQPELTDELQRLLSEYEFKTLLTEMHRLPYVSSVETVGVINEFFQLHRLWPTVGGDMTDGPEILRALERWATRNPKRLLKLLRESWLADRI